MLRRIREYLQSPIYRRETRSRGCRDQGVFITLWVFVGVFYLEMICLILGAALDMSFLSSTTGAVAITTQILDLACRILGVMLTVDCFSGERTQRTLDGLILSPVPRPTLVLAKFLARLRPLRLPLLAMVPGLVVFAPSLAYFLAPELPVADRTASPGGLGAFAGLSLSLYTLSFYPFISAALALFFGSSIGMFCSLAIKDNGLAVGLAFAAVMISSLGFCFISYFMIGLSAAFGVAAHRWQAALWTLPVVIVILEELITRGLPGFLLLLWAVKDFDRLAAD